MIESKTTIIDIINKSNQIRGTVDTIEFHGVKSTKSDALKKEVAELFKANNLGKLIRNSGRAALHMTVITNQEMGLFEDCHALVDTSSKNEGNYTVRFFAQELKSPIKITAKMEVRTTGELDAGINGKKANIFGRGESADLAYAKGLRKDTGYSFGFTALKPLLGWQRYENIGVQVYKGSDYLRWNKADLFESATSFLYNKRYLENKLKSSVRFNMSWRQFMPRNDTAFAVREHAGHTTKFSLEHVLKKDSRDRPILPTKGSLCIIETELAPGILGDSAFFKNIIDCQTAASLPYGFLLGASFRVGSVHGIADRSIHLLDRLYLGGPYDVRGFDLNSIGLKAENCALGGAALFSTALHLYAPLFPRDMLYSHFFVTMGSLSSVRSKQHLQDLWYMQRISAGLGLVLNFMNFARIELNYVLPLRRFAGDSCSMGLQFGAGINFM